MPPAADHDTSPVHRFRIEIDGVAQAEFSECTGLAVETEVLSFREGSERAVFRKVPGLTKYSNLTLKRGFTPNRDLWDWYRAVIDGKPDRRTVAIVLLNRTAQPVARWVAQRAWPCKWEGPAFDALGNDVAIETLELAHEGLEWEE